MWLAPAAASAFAVPAASVSYTASDEQRQASFAPDALNAAIISSRFLKPSLVMASMPPASKKFLVKVARAVNSASVPRLARKILGRAPVAAAQAPVVVYVHGGRYENGSHEDPRADGTAAGPKQNPACSGWSWGNVATPWRVVTTGAPSASASRTRSSRARRAPHPT